MGLRMETVPTGAAVLWTTLGRLRRRQRRVTLAENGLAAAIVIAAAAVPLSFSLAPGIAARVIVLLACCAAAGVVVVAIVRTPTPRRIAALADARLHLEDRLVTALQYVDDPDAVSRLVVRDAASRIADASPASVFPFRAAAWIAWIAAAALTASAVLTLIATKTSSGGVLQTDAQSGAGVSGAAANTDGSIRSGEAASSGPTSREHALQQSGPAPARALDSATGADRTGDRGPATGPRAAQSAGSCTTQRSRATAGRRRGSGGSARGSGRRRPPCGRGRLVEGSRIRRRHDVARAINGVRGRWNLSARAGRWFRWHGSNRWCRAAGHATGIARRA